MIKPMIALLCTIVLVHAVPASATLYWASPAGSDAATCANIDSTSIEDDPGSYGTIRRAAECATVAGDIVNLKAGTYTGTNSRINTANSGFGGNIDVANGFKSGTAESVRTIIQGHPLGARPLIQPGTTFYCTYDGANNERNFITLQYLEIDEQGGAGCSAGIQISGHHVTINDVIIYNTYTSAIAFSSSSGTNTNKSAFGVVRNSVIHDVRLGGTQGYCVYGQSTDLLLEHNECYRYKGWGWHIYTGTANTPDRLTARNNYIHDALVTGTNFCGGIVAYGTGHKIYDNRIEITTATCPTATATVGGIQTRTSGGFVEIDNNLVINPRGHGIEIGAGQTGYVTSNVIWSVRNDAVNIGAGATPSVTNNACHGDAVTAGLCGSATQILTDLTDCFISASDIRLKQGANLCRDNAAGVPTRISVDTGDIGPHEQGKASLAVALDEGGLEVTIVVNVPPVQPSTGLTGYTVTCVSCTGSPVVSAASVKPGSSNVVQLTLAGLTAPGTCTLNVGATNTSAGLPVGPLSGSRQTINSVTGLTVSGTCANTSGGSPPATPFIVYTFDDGSTATDQAGSNHGTLVGSPTFQTPMVSGYGVYFANDGADRSIDIPYGSGVNPTTQSLTICGSYALDSGAVNRIIFGSPLGTNQRFYVGTSGGNTWQIGVQGSTFSATGESEFPVVHGQITRICLIADAVNDVVVLAVNGVLGTSAAARKAITSYTLSGNFAINCGASTTAYCGGLKVDEFKIWQRVLDQSELDSDFAQFSQVGVSLACYRQQDFQAQRVYLDGSLQPINYLSAGASSVPVVAGGGIAIVMQVDCVGSAGASVAFRWRYAKNGGSYSLIIPDSFGSDGIAMWGASTLVQLNDAAVSDCVSGALTEHYGPTQLVSGATPTVALAQNHSYCLRAIVKVATDQTGNSFMIRLYQDNGAELEGGYIATPRLDVGNPQASGGF